MRARVIASSLLIMLSASPALAENWREVSNRDAVVSYIDADAIKRDGDKVRFWMELRLPQVQTAPTGERFDRMAAMVEINCRAKTYRSLRQRANLGDRLIHEGKSPVNSARAVTPGTPGDAELRAVCFDDWGSAE